MTRSTAGMHSPLIVLRIVSSVACCCRLVCVLGAVPVSVTLSEVQVRVVEFWQVRQRQVQQLVSHRWPGQAV